MRESKYTPGPWRIDDISMIGYKPTIVGGGKCPFVCDVRGPGQEFRSPSPITEANAYLIAAAPDMYAELKRLSEAFGWGDQHPALQAIAKAEGKA